jgi:uncharacterized protein (DUF1778 family)
MLAKYEGVHLNSVIMDAILEKAHTTIIRGTITEFDSTASMYNST